MWSITRFKCYCLIIIIYIFIATFIRKGNRHYMDTNREFMFKETFDGYYHTYLPVYTHISLVYCALIRGILYYACYYDFLKLVERVS